MFVLRIVLVAIFSVALTVAQAEEVRIEVQADQVLHSVSRYLTGACLEDVNHEVYGGIDSQMIFGESFAEPARALPLQGFSAYGGRWLLEDGELHAAAGDGPKLIRDALVVGDGEVSVDVFFPDQQAGNAGLILKVNRPGPGADRFTGYEIALETAGRLVLGRHRQNWEPIRSVPCNVPIHQWIRLAVRMRANSLEVSVNGQTVTHYEDTQYPLEAGRVGLRTWQREARFRKLVVSAAGETRKLDFAVDSSEAWGGRVSGMWRALRHGNAMGEFQIEELDTFSGPQSQRLAFTSGQGEIGVENQGLNRWGMHFIAGRVYEGFVCVRAAQPIELFVALESRDGGKVYAEKSLEVSGTGWQRLNFRLSPDASDEAGRFALKLIRTGSLTVGYAFLQPGEWGRFAGLPVRKDVADGLIEQGITVLRQGGCMVNADDYRWKKMIGSREQRPPYTGWWYPYSSNGWGIFEFLSFCEAAGFLGIPAVNMGETPQDMADFIEYVNGPADSTWGRRRAADGHPEPYGLKYLQLGNEERVDESYAARFEALAKAIWAKDTEVILVVGDFVYSQLIQDPFRFRGAASGITTLAGQQQILQLAQKHDREVWFDVHVGTDGPRPDSTLTGMFSFRDALDQIADGAKHQVVVFEFNAGNHSQRRALANALAIHAILRDGRIPVVTSANCLQPDGQNDNDWNQGLLFLNPSKVWLQPPGYITRMFSRNHLPKLVPCQVIGVADTLDVIAKRDEDGQTVVLQAVNSTDHPLDAQIQLAGFVPKESSAQVTELSGPLTAHNTADRPASIVPQTHLWEHKLENEHTRYTFPPFSVTVLRFE